MAGTGAHLLAALCLLVLLPVAACAADAISIDFQGQATSAMAANEVAGVIPRSNWNNAQNANGSATALVGNDGVATTAAVTWASSNAYLLNITESVGDMRMMRGYLDNTDTSTTTVTVSGLPAAFATYDVYVYCSADLGTNTSNGVYTIASAPLPGIQRFHDTGSAFSGTFVKGNGLVGNYVIFRGVTGSGFTLTATPTGGSVPRAPVNGLQVVALAPVNRPLPFSGFTQNTVLENAPAPTPVPFDDSNTSSDGQCFFREGFAGRVDGLPLARFFASEADPLTRYALGPARAANVLWLTSGLDHGTLTLTSATRCSALRILAASGSGGGNGTCTIHFADATTATVAYAAPDWGGGGGGAPIGLGRLGRATRLSQAYNHAVDFALFETRIDLTGVGHSATSAITALDFALDFTAPGAPFASSVLAVSGATLGPQVDAIAPNLGLAGGGTAVTITGSAFTAATSVTIGGVAVASFSVVDDQHLTATTGGGMAVGPLDVVVGAGADHGTFAGGFTATATPTITGIVPASGSAGGGASVTITGTGFVNGATVTIGGNAAGGVTWISSTTIAITTPAMTGTNGVVDVVVTNPGSLTATAVGGYTYVLRNPDNPGGTYAGLNSLYYRAAAGGGQLPDFTTLVPDLAAVVAGPPDFGANPVEPARTSTFSLQFLGYVTVPSDGAYVFFTSSDDGSRLYIGNQLVVENNFSQPQTERSGTAGLKAGTHAITIQYAQGGGGFGMNVNWQGPGFAKQRLPASACSTDAPTITALTPDHGPGDNATATAFTITGTRFVATPTVYVGGALLGGVGFGSSTALTATAPAANPGSATVLVVNPDGKAALLAPGFGYRRATSPAITSISITTGGFAGGDAMTIAGSAFSSATVAVNGAAATITSQNATQIVITTPAIGALAVGHVVVTNDDLQTATSAQTFTYTGLRAPENPANTVAGLDYSYYRGIGAVLPADFSGVAPDLQGAAADPEYHNVNPAENRNDNWAIDYEGFLVVPSDGVYTLFTASDDGSRLYIGATLVVDNNFAQGTTERSGTIALLAGTHRLTIQGAQGGVSFELSARWQGPGLAKQVIPDAAYRTYALPAITGLTPDHCTSAGGKVVVVAGSGFVAQDAVTVLGAAPTSTTVDSGSQIHVTVPAHAVAAGALTVTNPLGFSASSTFTYLAPLVVATNTGVTVASGAAVTIETTMLAATQGGATAGQITYTVSSAPAHGFLRRNLVALAVSGTFTQADIDNDLISYEHGDLANGSDAFQATLAGADGETLGATTVAVTVGGTGLANGLVAWWRFGANGTLVDATGHGHDGAPVNAPAFARTAAGNALRFVAASAQFVTVPYDPAFGLSSYTVAARIRPASTGGLEKGILGTRFGGDNTFDLKWSATIVHGDIGDGTGWISTAADIDAAHGGTLVPGGPWRHVGYAVDGGAGHFRLALDGVVQNDTAFAGTPLLMKPGETMGVGDAFFNEYADGDLDDVRVYGRALGVGEARILGQMSAPVITGLDGDTAAFSQGGAAVALDTGADAAVSDADDLCFAGGGLQVVLTNRSGSDVLAVASGGALTVASGVVSFSGNRIGAVDATLDGSAGHDLKIAFDTRFATPAAVGALLRALTFANTDTPPSATTRQVLVTLDDNTLRSTATVAVTVARIPVITARQTIDSDHNGRIDRIRVVTDVALNDDFSGLTATVAGHSFIAFDSGATAHDNEFFIVVGEGAGGDTGATPVVTITANASLGGAFGNLLLRTDGGVAASDGAPPVLLAASWSDGGITGVSAGDTVTLTFSEAVTAASATVADLGLPVASDTLAGATFADQSGTTLTLTLAGSPRLTPGGTYGAGATGAGKPSGVFIASGVHLTDGAGLAAVTGAAGSAVDLGPTTTTVALDWVTGSDPKTWAIGTLTVGATASSLVPGIDLTIRDAGDCNADLVIASTASAPTGWTPAALAGTNHYLMKADVGGAPVTTPTDPAAYALTLTSAPQALASGLLSGRTVPLSLFFGAPTAVSAGGGVQQTMVVTVTAALAP